MSPMIRLPLTLEYALLGFLRQRPMHGYEIHQQLSDPAGLRLVWRLKQSQLYALLTKLEEEGYVTASLKPQDTRPTRRVYRLTKSGRERFLDWVRTPVPHGREVRQEFFAKFYFAQREGVDVAKRLIGRQRTACRDWLSVQQPRDAPRADQSFAFLVSQFRIGQIRAILTWLDTCEQSLT